MTDGKLRVWHIWYDIPNSRQERKRYPVEGIDAALALINTLADKQVQDDSVSWIAFGLEIRENRAWVGWENELGEGIDVIARLAYEQES